ARVIEQHMGNRGVRLNKHKLGAFVGFQSNDPSSSSTTGSIVLGEIPVAIMLLLKRDSTDAADDAERLDRVMDTLQYRAFRTDVFNAAPDRHMYNGGIQRVEAEGPVSYELSNADGFMLRGVRLKVVPRTDYTLPDTYYTNPS
ncbi:MAG: hypothetical protein AAGJ10_20560, partial [Bacteroidota bacterium]